MWSKEHLIKTWHYYLEKYILYYILSPKMYIRWRFKQKNGYPLNLSNPKTFCEKIQWLKFNNIRPDFTKLVDKIDAKEYASSIIGSDYIIPTIGVWDNISDIDWDSLPNSFVIKVTNDSGGIVICRDKSKLDIDSVKRKLSKRSSDYSKNTFEYPYKHLVSRIIVEQLMTNGTDLELKDYKFYCFNGRAEYCQVIADRTVDETIDFFDRKWVHQPFIGLNPNVHHAINDVSAPTHYDEMLNIADKIATSVNHPFVRVDLYNVNGKIYFGEITFFPSSGFGHIHPIEWDRKLGDMIILND